MNAIRQKDFKADLLSIVLTITAAYLVLFLSVFLLSKDPGKSIYYLMAGPFINNFYFGNLLNSMVPLIFTGLGMAIAFKADLFNLGGEGQVYSGGITAVIIGLSFSGSSLLTASGLGKIIGIFCILLGSFIAAGLLAAISGFFKMKWNANELLSSFLISNICILVINHLVRSVFNDPQNNLIATWTIPQEFFLKRIFLPSSLNSSVWFAVTALVFCFVYLFRTRQGYELRLCGLNRQFARYGGIASEKYLVIPLFLSGGLHGLAGAASVLGTHHSVIQGFSSGMGWNGIAIALIARNHPLAVIPAAFFLAYLDSGAKSAMIHSDLTLEIVSIAQAVVFLLITARVVHDFIRYGRMKSRKIKPSTQGGWGGGL